MPTTVRRTRAAHLGPERRRPQVLDTALEVALAEGVNAVTIAAVAQRMGVTRPVVYACFTDRVELVEALLDRESEVLLASVLTALHDSGVTEDPERAFVDGFTALLTTVTERPDAWLFLLHGAPDPAVADRFARARAKVRDRATDWIGPAMAHWWRTDDLDRKLPVLIELFMSSCESAIRSLLDPTNDWGAEELGDLIGHAVHRAFADA